MTQLIEAMTVKMPDQENNDSTSGAYYCFNVTVWCVTNNNLKDR